MIDISELDDLPFNTDQQTSENPTHYVDKIKFYEAFVDYKQDKLRAEELEEPKPPIPNYICECIMKICNNTSYHHSTINYTYRDEMVQDAIEICIRYIDNYDPDYSNNAFAYFTQTAKQTFWRRRETERKQHYFKLKTFDNLGGYAAVSEAGVEEEHVTDVNETMDQYKDYLSYIDVFEKSKREKTLKYAKPKNKKVKAQNSVLNSFLNFGETVEDCESD